MAGWMEVRLELSVTLALMLVTKYTAKSILAPFGQHTAPFLLSYLAYKIPIVLSTLSSLFLSSFGVKALLT